MNTIKVAPPLPFTNAVNNIASTPSHSTREPTMPTANLQRQHSAPTQQGSTHSNPSAVTIAPNGLVDDEQQYPTSATYTETERLASPLSDNQVASISCMNCGTTTTPLWRRAPNGDTICNACGLYLKARHTYRPTTMKRNIQPKKRQQPQADPSATTTGGGCGDHGSDSISGSCPGGGKCNGTGGSSSCAGCPTFNNQQLRRQQEQQLEGLVCANCATTTTPLWRRDDQGNTICNACGLYYKLHHVHRPVSMKRSVIKRRRRLIVMGSGGDDQGDEEDSVQGDDQQGRSIDHVQPQETPQPSSTPKKIRKPYRKRIKANDEGSDQQAKGKRSRPSDQSTKLALSVPAIEDYIVPKRTGLPATAELGHSSSPSSHSTVTPPPPPSMSDLHHQALYHHSSSTRLDGSPSSLSLPPISSERRSAHFDPFYRDGRAPSPTSTSSSSTINASLPPISLPPLLRPTATTPSTNNDMSTRLNTTTSTYSSPFPPSPTSTGSSSAFTSTRPAPEMDPDHLQQQPYPTFVELEDWDEALKNLQQLRKKVQPEHVRALAELSKPLWDMVSKAQSIVHGTGAFSHP